MESQHESLNLKGLDSMESRQSIVFDVLPRQSIVFDVLPRHYLGMQLSDDTPQPQAK